FGTDYDTPDGTAVRDYIHVTDLARAHVLALKALVSRSAAPAYNLGIGRGYTVREVVEVCRKVSGREIRAVEGPRRAGDPAVLVADPSRARRELGWEPQFTELGPIIETAWRWMLKRSGER
ncbi:MAG: GDP-mannose 4,6-dehydratase, partial [Gemmatimonadota bacterium]